MTDPRETLNRIREQVDNATEGPWRHISVFEVGGFVEDSHGRELFDWAQDDAGTICVPDPDAEFIAAARTTVPALVDALEKVLELHSPLAGRPFWDAGIRCSGCYDSYYDVYEPYPCELVEAITAALDAIK